jgi:hypothetical protein
MDRRSLILRWGLTCLTLVTLAFAAGTDWISGFP